MDDLDLGGMERVAAAADDQVVGHRLWLAAIGQVDRKARAFRRDVSAAKRGARRRRQKHVVDAGIHQQGAVPPPAVDDDFHRRAGPVGFAGRAGLGGELYERHMAREGRRHAEMHAGAGDHVARSDAAWRLA